MERNKAAEYARKQLSNNNLDDWGVRLTTSERAPLGLCSYKDKCIILSAHSIDIHPEMEVYDTVLHEVAHALTPNDMNHGDEWKNKAIELGCKPSACSSFSLDPNLIDAIRSGATIEYTIEEEIIRTPKVRITRLQDKCPECGKVAIEKFRTKAIDKAGNECILITLSCFHITKKIIPKATPFETLISNEWKDEVKNCKHEWDKNRCIHCNEFKLFNFQIAGARFIEHGLAIQKGTGIFDDMGLGKVSSINTPILTVNGWKLNKDLKIGDLVIASDGNPYPIIGLYPQGLVDLYKVYFSDGSTTNCGDEHLWIINTAVRKYRGNPSLVKAWKDIKNDLFMTSTNSSNKLNNKWYIPITKPVNFNSQEIKIDPYLLGLLLGDGSFAQENNLRFTSADKELSDYVGWKQINDLDYRCNDKNFKWELDRYNLIFTKSNTKFIPNEYKFNSVNIRLNILRGLMDTDGSIWSNGVVEYTTVSKLLADDVLFLVESLGGTVRLTSKEEPKYTYKGETLIGQKCYRLVINIPINPFKLKRKSDSWLSYNLTKKYRPTRAITGYEYIGREEGQCIAIASPDHSYLTENCIVTHNTVQALAYVKYHPESLPVLYIVKSAIKFNWLKEILRWLGPDYLGQIINTSKDFIIPNLKTYIIAYDLLRRMPADKLESIGIKLIVMDECQQIKNVNSGRTQAVRKIVNKPEIKVIPLSGTPWKNRGSEFFPVLNMLSPTKFWSAAHFQNNWVEYYYEGSKRKEGGINRPDKFKEYVQDIIIRREYNEVMDEYPDINRMKIRVQLDDLTQKEYDSATSNFIAWYNEAVISGTDESLSGIEILAKLAKMRHITGLAKIPATISFAEEFYENTDKSLVVFVHHQDVGAILYDEFKKLFPDVNVCKITGAMSDVEKYEATELFNKKRSFMIASTLAAGEGINLQSCHDSIMHERQWNPQNEDQAAPGRFRRIGQKSSVINISFCEAEETVDEFLDHLVEKKRIAFHSTMNNSKMVIWSENDMGKELAKMIMGKHRASNKNKIKSDDRPSLTSMARL